MDIEKLKKYTKLKHGGQKRKHGTPYYLHSFSVAQILKEKGYDINYQIAALFHDLLEDTDTTYEEILSLSNIDVADTVKLVTKEKNYNMNNYINY